jgi:UDP-glucose 4-epimerase
MKKKGNCLILGGGGFIGSNLCEELLSRGYNVTVFDKLNFSQKNIQEFENSIEIIEGDFSNEIDVEKSLDGIDYVYHLVSTTIPATSNANPTYDVETNLISSLKLFEVCLAKKIKKIIFLSSGGTVYGIPEKVPVTEDQFSNPICSYGIVKRSIEEYLFMFNKLYGMDYNVFRMSNPYGEKQNPHAAQGVIPVFLYKAILKQPIEIWGDGEVVRDYIYIKDAVKVLASSIEVNSDRKIFNLSSGEGRSLNDILNIIKKVMKEDLKVEFREGRKLDVPVNVLDNTRVKEIFNWQPEISLEEGIKNTYDYLKENYSEN